MIQCRSEGCPIFPCNPCIWLGTTLTWGQGCWKQSPIASTIATSMPTHVGSWPDTSECDGKWKVRGIGCQTHVNAMRMHPHAQKTSKDYLLIIADDSGQFLTIAVYCWIIKFRRVHADRHMLHRGFPAHNLKFQFLGCLGPSGPWAFGILWLGIWWYLCHLTPWGPVRTRLSQEARGEAEHFLEETWGNIDVIRCPPSRSLCQKCCATATNLAILESSRIYHAHWHDDVKNIHLAILDKTEQIWVHPHHLQFDTVRALFFSWNRALRYAVFFA